MVDQSSNLNETAETHFDSNESRNRSFDIKQVVE